MSITPLVRCGLAAGLLISLVAAELISPAFGDSVAGHLAFAGSQLAGWLLIGSVLRSLPAGPSRRERFGRRSLLVGCVLQVAFAAVFGLTSTDADPLEAAFVLFLVGFLALFVGGVTWGPALSRRGHRLTGRGLTATAALGLGAMVVGQDPFHDVFLLASYAAWVLVGAGVQHDRVRPEPRRVVVQA